MTSPYAKYIPMLLGNYKMNLKVSRAIIFDVSSIVIQPSLPLYHCRQRITVVWAIELQMKISSKKPRRCCDQFGITAKKKPTQEVKLKGSSRDMLDSMGTSFGFWI